MEENGPEGIRMQDAKSVTPSVFGLLIAYLLPGLFAVITAGLLFAPVGNLLLEFSKASSSTGLAILLLLTALLSGLQLHILQWAVYEELFLGRASLSSEVIAKLRTPSKAVQGRPISNAGRSGISLPSICGISIFRDTSLCVRPVQEGRAFIM